MGDLSEHFSQSEFECPCCGAYIHSTRLIAALERLRRECGGEVMTILSGTRCAGWNEKVGGVPGSQHLLGLAADVVVRGLHPIEIADRAELVPAFVHGGLGLYEHRGFVHVDVRNGRARWSG